MAQFHVTRKSQSWYGESIEILILSASYPCIPDGLPIVIAGMEGQSEFRGAVLEEKGILDSGKIEQEVVQVTRKLVTGNPQIGAILLECSDLPPYAGAIQQAVNLPVYDFVTMINYVHNTHVRFPFAGFM